MSNSNGFIRLDRRLCDWQWYTDNSMKAVWIHILLNATWKPIQFQGMELPRGSYITSVRKLAEQTSLSANTVRRCLDNLVKTGEIEKSSTPSWTIIKVKKYNQYQAGESAEAVSTIDTAVSTIDTPNDTAVSGSVSTIDTAGCASVSGSVSTIDTRRIIKNKDKNKEEIHIYAQSAQITQSAQTDFAQYFYQFWLAYPRKVNKVRAEKAWNETITDLTTMSAASEGATAMLRIAQYQDKRFIPYPETFIRERRWENQDIQDEVKRMNAEAKQQAAEHDQQQ